MDKPLRPLVAVAVLATVLVGLAACSDDGDDPVDAASTSATSGNGGSGSGSGSTGGNGNGGGAHEGGAGRGRGQTLATTTGQHVASPLDDRMVPLRIDVTGLQRNGDLVELYMTLINETDVADLTYEPYSDFGADTPAGSYDLAGISLVDQAGQKLYLPVLDSEGTCLCTGDLTALPIPPGESAELAATFGGIPDGVETLDLHVPGFDPATGLEVTG